MNNGDILPWGSILLPGDEMKETPEREWEPVPEAWLNEPTSKSPKCYQFRRPLLSVSGISDLAEAHVTLETGAKRSAAYPKGARFPARYDLMMRNAAGMRRLAETWGEGFAKYGADNWFKGFAESVLLAHALEHIRLHLAGDTSEDHAAHGAWNLLALCWIEENKPELMDLSKPEQKA